MKAKGEIRTLDGKIYPAVSQVGLKDEMWLVKVVVHDVFNERGYEAKITAGTEALRLDIHKNYAEEIHGYNSVHPFGYALDFSTEGIDRVTVADMVTEILNRCNAVRNGYEIIIHTDSHIHCEWDLRVKGKA